MLVDADPWGGSVAQALGDGEDFELLFAVRQSAMARLQSEGLAFPFKVRSLVRRSADKVLRGL